MIFAIKSSTKKVDFLLCKVRTVSFEKLASAFESKAMRESSLRRIQKSYCKMTKK